MYFVFMNARVRPYLAIESYGDGPDIIILFQLNIHKFKCIARFGLAHIAATNLCVWLRTVVKECTKEISQYRVDRGQGVSEDYMILGKQ